VLEHSCQARFTNEGFEEFIIGPYQWAGLPSPTLDNHQEVLLRLNNLLI
jgi:hypothetical protein